MIPRLTVPIFLVIGAMRSLAQSPAEELARVLRDRQIITSSEFDRVMAAGSEGTRQLAAILRDKGVITASEFASLHPGSTRPEPEAIAAARPASSGPAMAGPAQKAGDPGSDADRKLKFYGTVLFNAFFTDQGSNSIDIPASATPKSPSPQDNFGATARQTRLGLSFSGLKAGNANVSGTAEVDFFGGIVGLSNGIDMNIVRMRLAYGRMDWKRFAIEAGQDWTIFSPLNPTSFAAYAVPEFSGSGNLWMRTPQIRAEWKNDGGNVLWQIAALDPDIGDNPAVYSIARVPRAGELGRLPAVETRLALSKQFDDRTATLGLSAHWGTAKNTTPGVPGSRAFESWGASVDYNLPITKLVNISGEAFAGRALGLFSGGDTQTVFALGQPGANGVGSRGGWLQVQLNPTKKLQSNTAYGIDLPDLSNLPTGSRSKNQNYMSNIVYHVSPNVIFALEWRRFLTNYRNQPLSNNIGDHINLAAAYTF